MLPFTYTSLPGRVLFGRGRISALADEVARLGAKRVLVLATPGQAALGERLASMLGSTCSGVYAEARMHVPAEIVAAATDHALRRDVDALVAVGGGSTIGLGKAMARETGMPQIAVPTTYAGSEMTPIWGITRDGIKTTGRELRVLPRTVIYDPELSQALPPEIAAVSGMNAIAHCVEGLYAEDANPVTSMMAEEAIGALARSLPRIVAQPDDLQAREEAIYGAWLSGTVLGTMGMALHHKLCHTLGGSFDLPHAQTHSVMIPQVTAFNATAAPEAMARIARALGSESAAGGLFELAGRLQVPRSLRELGMDEADLDRAAELACAKPYYNPRAITQNNIRELLAAAWEGREPE